MPASAATAFPYQIKVKPLDFSPEPGSFPGAVTVGITCDTPGADIYYTLDGTTPTDLSPLYTQALVIKSTTKIMAIGMMDQLVASDVISGTFVIEGDPYEPDNTPTQAQPIAAGETQNRSIHTKTDVDWVKFTLTQYSEVTIETNGPSGLAEMWLLGPNSSTTILDHAVGTAGKFPVIQHTGNSALNAGGYYLKIQSVGNAQIIPAYTLTLHVTPIARSTAPPVLSPLPGIFYPSVALTATCPTAGAVMYYTTDGATPDGNATVFPRTLTLTRTTLLTVVAIKDGYTASTPVSGMYTIAALPIVAKPVCAPVAGAYPGSVTATITCATAGADLRYTTNGADPTSASTKYTAPFKLTASGTVKVKGSRAGMTDSAITSAAYVITPAVVASPVISVPGGILHVATLVKITCATPGAIIRYTMDGSTPTVTATAYTLPLLIVANQTLTAKAFKDGMPDSGIAQASYQIVGDAYEPDNGANSARAIASGDTQARSIHIPGDEDWVRFVLTKRSNVTIMTSGPQGGDTEMYLYGPNNAAIFIAYDDDGNGAYSKITRSGATALDPGSYYVRVKAHSSTAVIASYSLSLTVTQ